MANVSDATCPSPDATPMSTLTVPKCPDTAPMSTLTALECSDVPPASTLTALKCPGTAPKSPDTTPTSTLTAPKCPDTAPMSTFIGPLTTDFDPVILIKAVLDLNSEVKSQQHPLESQKLRTCTILARMMKSIRFSFTSRYAAWCLCAFRTPPVWMRGAT